MGSRRLTRAMVVVAAAAVFAGGGLVYAHWNSLAEVEGIVRTGQVESYWATWNCAGADGGGDLTATPVDWAGHAGLELVEATVPPGFDIWRTNKDVAETVIVSPAALAVTNVAFRIDNAYPSHYEECAWQLGNIGTVPLAVPYAVVRATNPDTTFASTIFAEDGVLWVDLHDGVPTAQVNPQGTADGVLRIHVEQIAQQDDLYEFEVDVCLHNWNEPSTPADDICGLYEPHEVIDGTVIVIPGS